MEDKRLKCDFSAAKHVIEYRHDGRVLDAYFFDIDQDPPIEVGEVYEFFQIWKNKYVGGHLPAWTDFDFTDFKGWHSNMKVIERRVPVLGKTRTMIMGDQYSKYWGDVSFKDHIDNAEKNESDTTRSLTRHLEYLHQPLYCIGNGLLPKSDSSLTPTFWVELPLSEDGENITHFLNAAKSLPPQFREL